MVRTVPLVSTITISTSHQRSIIIIKNEKIRVTLCETTAGALYIVNKMCVDGRRKLQVDVNVQEVQPEHGS